MGALFSAVAKDIVPAEGDVDTDVSTDLGGETKFGISKKSFPSINISNLTLQGALNIYETEYWNKYRLNEINDQVIANQIFFLLINMPPTETFSIVQTALNAVGTPIYVDGVLGSLTIEAINNTPVPWFSDRIRLEAIRYYLRLSDKDHSQIANFRGWVRRALR